MHLRRRTGASMRNWTTRSAAIYQVAIFEALVLAAKMGMDCGALLEVMRTASAASTQIERIGGGILDREFDGLGRR